MNFTTYSIGTEQEFKNIKMQVHYPDEKNPKIVGCISDSNSAAIVYITIDNTVIIQDNPCILEGILEICTIPCESNAEAILNDRVEAIDAFVKYFESQAKILTVECQNPCIKLSDKYYLWIYDSLALSFHMEPKNPNNDIRSCANQLTIGMTFNNLMQLLDYDESHSKPKDFSMDLSWFRRWDENPFQGDDIKLRFAYDYILSMFVKADKINKFLKVPVNYHPGELNHANIKNAWGVLPRTPIYRIFDLFNQSQQLALQREIQNKVDLYGVSIHRFWDHFKDTVNHNDDLFIRSGLLDTADTINSQTTFLFEYRSVKLKVSDIYEDDKKIIWKNK